MSWRLSKKICLQMTVSFSLQNFILTLRELMNIWKINFGVVNPNTVIIIIKYNYLIFNDTQSIIVSLKRRITYDEDWLSNWMNEWTREERCWKTEHYEEHPNCHYTLQTTKKSLAQRPDHFGLDAPPLFSFPHRLPNSASYTNKREL